LPPLDFWGGLDLVEPPDLGFGWAFGVVAREPPLLLVLAGGRTVDRFSEPPDRLRTLLREGVSEERLRLPEFTVGVRPVRSDELPPCPEFQIRVPFL
jgi:hypothetical protein